MVDEPALAVGLTRLGYLAYVYLRCFLARSVPQRAGSSTMKIMIFAYCLLEVSESSLQAYSPARQVFSLFL